MVKHPAKFTDIILESVIPYLVNCPVVLDIFAGTGKVAKIKELGFSGKVYCNELESEWIDKSYQVDKWTFTDSENLVYESNTIDCIFTSPTYGNRMADCHNAKDASKRITYTHTLGRKLTNGNTGYMQWGESYRDKHNLIYKEAIRVLKSNGLFIVNISNHIRKGVEVDVCKYHNDLLISLGLIKEKEILVNTPRMRRGSNYEKRVHYEKIFIFRKIS